MTLFKAAPYRRRLLAVALVGSLVIGVSPSGAVGPTISTVAGGGIGDGGHPSDARLNHPEGVSTDSTGNLLIADSGHHRIRKATPSEIFTLAGTGIAGFSGDNGPALDARLNYPKSVVTDGASYYIADFGNHRIRKVQAGNISSIAGNGTCSFSGDNVVGGAGSAGLCHPSDLALRGGPAAELFIADTGDSINPDAGNRIRKLVLSSLTITTAAGGGIPVFLSGGGIPVFLTLSGPEGVGLSGGSVETNSLDIADTGNDQVKRLDLVTGAITTKAGGGLIRPGQSVVEAQVQAGPLPGPASLLDRPVAVTSDPDGRIYIADSAVDRVYVIDVAGNISHFAGGGSCSSGIGDGQAAANACLNDPSGLAVGSGALCSNVSSHRCLYIADSGNDRIRKINLTTGIIETAVGGGVGDGGAATSGWFAGPNGIVQVGSNFYVADPAGHRVRRLNWGGSSYSVTTLAGTGFSGYSGDGGDPLGAALKSPTAVAHHSGTTYIADTGNNVIRKITPSNFIETLDTGALSSPAALATDSSGNLYVADTGSNRILKVGFDSFGDVATVDVLLTGLAAPRGLAASASADLFISDTGNGTILKRTSSGTLSTLATGLISPRGLIVDSSNNVYVADAADHRVKKVDSSGNVSNVAGSGSAGFSGDAGDPHTAQLNGPCGVALDGNGKLLIADTGNGRVRRVA